MVISHAEVKEKVEAAVNGTGHSFSLSERLAYIKALMEVLDAPEATRTDAGRRAVHIYKTKLTPYSGLR